LVTSLSPRIQGRILMRYIPLDSLLNHCKTIYTQFTKEISAEVQLLA
jgi:hypothetical protein